MMATIRIGASLFKSATKQIRETKEKITTTVTKLRGQVQSLAQRLKKRVRSFFSFFAKKKAKTSPLILIERQPTQEKQRKAKQFKNKTKPKKFSSKKNEAKQKASHKAQMKILASEQVQELSPVIPIKGDTIKNFYKEWEASWGPALTPLDKQFLESASPEVVAKVIANARLTIKSPYLKAVYNGLKDLEDISDLLEKDELAKNKVMPVFKDYWDRGPEKFSEMLLFMHDKGVFPTRSGERRLSLDPRLVPEWLGLVS